MEINLNNGNYCVQYNPLESDCLTYEINNNILEAGKFVKYKITHFQNDLLVLETIDSKLNKDRLNRYYFLLKEDIIKKNPPKTDGDVAIMNRYTCPMYKGDFKDNLSKRLKGKYTTTNFKGYFDIDHNTKSLSTTIIDDGDTRKKFLI